LKRFALIAMAVALGACSRSDTQQVRQELKTSGEELKKELKSDARVAKQEAIKAGHEARAEAEKAKKDLNHPN
jgi:hypothetical protein